MHLIYRIITGFILPLTAIITCLYKNKKNKLNKQLLENMTLYPDFDAKPLLEQKADPNYSCKDLYINTPLCIAANYENINNIKLLLECKANVNYPDKWGRTPLMYSLPSLSCVNLLLDNKADTNQSDYKGETAYFHLLKKIRRNNGDRAAIIKQLLKYNSNPLHVNFEKKSALSIAKEMEENPLILQLFMEAEEKHYKEIKYIIYCSLFTKNPLRQHEPLNRLANMDLFDKNLIKKEVFSFLY